MIRKLILSLVLLALLPSFANAWYVNAKTSPDTGQGTISPAGNLSYPAGVNSGEFTVTPAPGYSVARVTLDGVNLAANGNGKYVVPYLSTKTWRYLVAYFAAGTVTITTQVSAGSGTIREDSNESLTNIPLGSSRQLLVIPNPGYAIESITAAGAAITDNGNGSKTVVYTNLQSNKSVSASFSLIPVLSVDAGGDVAAYGTGVDYAVTLNGSASSNQGAISYVWSGAGLSFGTPNAATTTVYAATPGSYTATLTVSSGGLSQQDSATVTVFNRAEYLSAVCTNCHSMNTPQVVADYNSGKHPGKTACQDCHSSEPHTGVLPTSAPCVSCHADATGEVASHPMTIGSNPCLSCHYPHSTTVFAGAPDAHYNNVTSAGYPASYMTSRSVCAHCHSASASNDAIRSQWAASGHSAGADSAWRGYDFKTVSGCVQCHSTTGFIAYSSGRMTAAWGVESDKTKEVLTCVGCHSDVSNGTLRQMAPVTPFANDSYTNPDLGKSNLCMGCHSGTNNGQSIVLQFEAGANFSDFAFIPPHYQAAGGVTYAKAGYHFPGRSYSAEAKHGSIGSQDAAGPCVSCHKSATFGHTFQGGVVPLCAGCHGASYDGARLDADRAAFASVMEVLRAQLAAKGFPYSADYPYFSARDWGTGQAGANTLGAAFNYAMLAKEPGAFAHNPDYAKQLALDSIDYLDNGQLDDSAGSLAVPTLLDAGAISQAVADSFASYQAKNRCISCHGGTTATPNPMSSQAHAAHLSGNYGPGSYLGTDIYSCQVCHVNSSVTHMNGAADLLNGAGSACQGCHAGALPSWSAATRLDCTACHAAVPARLPNGVAAPYKANFTSIGHGRYLGSSECSYCHDPDSRHISGSLGSYKRLRLPNDNNLCASCHSDPGLVRTAFLNMVSHVTKDGRTLACLECHDPHGATNPGMIRSSVNGYPIAFSEVGTGLIDQVSNRGFCQVCHTLTSHYRAGVPETSHYVSGCLSCHTHNSAGGAFQPIDGSCDTCHGYPPAPRNTGISFGTVDNWANARFEDYSGGGGAHLVGAHIPATAKPSEGWTNCTVCHNGGSSGNTPYHKMILPLKTNISNVTVVVDPKLRFAEGFTVYTGARQVNPPAQNATGSCFNIACHMSPSPRWSTER